MMTWSMVLAIGGMVGLPLTIMVHYLRAIRDDQRQLRHEHATLERRVSGIEREYTTKEEWVRETALLRRQLEKVTELLIALQSRIDTEAGLTAQLSRLVDTLLKVVQQ